MEHESIEQASVVGVPRKDGSETVAAAVILAAGATLDKDALRAFAANKLTKYKVPRIFQELKELPADQMGKVRRREVQDIVKDFLKDIKHD